MINIKKLIESLFPDKKPVEQYQHQSTVPTPEGIASISNSVTVNNGDASFPNANFGIQQNYYVTIEQPDASRTIASSIVTAKLDSIQALAEKCKFTDALTGYKELLEDYNLMATVDKSVQSRVLLGMISSYICLSDFKNAEKYLQHLKRDKLPLNEKGYSIIISYYLNQRSIAFYKEAEGFATESISEFPDSVISICQYALVKTIIDADFDGKQYLDANIHSIDKDEDKKRYYETLCNIFITKRDSNRVIATYKELDVRPTLPLHSQYICALYINSIYANGKEYVGRSDIDFSKLYAVWQAIQEIEKSLTDDETHHFRHLIADVYLNCIILLDKETNRITQDLLFHAQEETKESFSFWLSVANDFGIDSCVNLPRNEKVAYIDSLLEQKKFTEAYGYLWPAIKTDEELKRLFKYLLLNICIEIRDEIPGCFVECLSYFKQSGTFDDYMKLIECAYIYHAESKQRSLQEMDVLYEKSQDPKVILELTRFAFKVGEVSFASDKLTDIELNKPFIIDIEPSDYYGQCFRLFANPNQGGEIVALLEKMGNRQVDPKLRLRMDAAKANFLGDLPTVASANYQLYELTESISYLYRSFELYLLLFDFTQLKNMLEVLSRAKYADDININILHAHYYTLIGDTEKALNAATKAKDLSVDFPMSPAHQLYWSLCLRSGNIAEIKYISEYAAKYPQHTQWVRSIKALEKDATGKETLTPEILHLFEQLRDDYSNIMQMYKENYALGISLVKDKMKWRLSDISHRINMLKVFTGDIEYFRLDRQKEIDRIALEPLCLYYIELLGVLPLLKKCEKVYIDYNTIALLSNDLLVNEDEHIREIFRFIKTASNIAFAFPSPSEVESISRFYEEKTETGALSCLLNAFAIAHDNEVPLVYMDMIAQPLSKVINADTISLFAFIKSAHSRGWLSDCELGNVILKMSEFGFNFLNIDGADLYYSLLVKGFDIGESFLKLIEIPPSADAASYVSVFIGLLQCLREYSNHDIIEKVVIALIETLDRRHGRTRDNYGRIRETIGTAAGERVLQVRVACELGISSVSACLFDFKSREEISDMIARIATRIPKEKQPTILNKANEMYSTYLCGNR